MPLTQNVNYAETNKKQAVKVNSDAVRNLVEVCEKKKIKLIHFSKITFTIRKI